MKAINDDQPVTYVHRHTRNPWKLVRSVWRLVRHLGPVEEAAHFEHMFMRSRFAGWSFIAKHVMREPKSLAELAVLPRWLAIDLDALHRDCPAGSLGHVFAAHMKHHGLNPNLFAPNACRSREEYVEAHLTETHDMWHVVTGFGNDLPGEAAIIAFTVAQTRAPMGSLLLAVLLFNTAFFAHAETDERFGAIIEGWQAGKKAKPLFGVDWDKHLRRPIEDVRRELGLPQFVAAGAGIFTRAA